MGCVRSSAGRAVRRVASPAGQAPLDLSPDCRRLSRTSPVARPGYACAGPGNGFTVSDPEVHSAVQKGCSELQDRSAEAGSSHVLIGSDHSAV